MTSCRPSPWGATCPRPPGAAVFRQMMGRDLVRPDPDRHGALRMTEAARPILRGEASDHPAARYGAGGRARRAVQTHGGGRGCAAAVGAEGQAPGAGRGGERARLCRLSRPHADRDGRTRARDAGPDGAASPGSARRSWKAMARAFLEVITGARPRRCIPRGCGWPGASRARSSTGWPRCSCSCARGEDGTGKPLSCHPVHPAQDRRAPALDPVRTGPGRRAGASRRSSASAQAFLAVLREG